MSKTTTLNNLFKSSSATRSFNKTEENVNMQPSVSVIANILNYSKALSIRSNDLLGQIEVVLN
jgi:hypothetical protein